jgi:putative acetyltransferase
MEYTIRSITQEDNIAMATIIRNVFEELDAPKTGTAYEDPYLYHLFEFYQVKRTAYFVVEANGIVLGGGGIGICDIEKNICELQKMYFAPILRGKGIGAALIEKCISFAKDSLYNAIYLETLQTMKDAQKLYKKYGFEVIQNSIGNTGHTSCGVFMLKNLY